MLLTKKTVNQLKLRFLESEKNTVMCKSRHCLVFRGLAKILFKHEIIALFFYLSYLKYSSEADFLNFTY